MLCNHFTSFYLFIIVTKIVFLYTGAVFLELWKRYSADITHRWDLTGFDTSEVSLKN